MVSVTCFTGAFYFLLMSSDKTHVELDIDLGWGCFQLRRVERKKIRLLVSGNAKHQTNPVECGIILGFLNKIQRRLKDKRDHLSLMHHRCAVSCPDVAQHWVTNVGKDFLLHGAIDGTQA